MPKFLARYQLLLGKEIEAFDLQAAERQAKMVGEEIRFVDSDGEPQHAALYSLEEIKTDNHEPTIPDDPFPFHPQRQRQQAA